MADEQDDALYRAYLAELGYLHAAGGGFAKRHPRVARRLELEDHGSVDPQVERLIESFAYLTARLQLQIDGEFPEIPSALLGVLYPHLVAPVPSCAIAAFEPDPEQSRALMGIGMPRETPLFANTGKGGPPMRFRTTAPLTLWPLAVGACELRSPADYAFLDDRPDVATVLRLGIDCLGKRSFLEMAPPALRLFLHGGPGVAPTLYRLLLDQCLAVAVLPDGARAPTAWLPAAAVRPCGFAEDEAALPHPDNAHQGYRLLQELVCFPEKFHFLEIDGLPRLGEGRRVELLFLLRERPAAPLALDCDTVRLNCVPMVNLFRQVSEPIRLDQLKSEYRLVPDSRWERWTEIHTIIKVSATSTGEDDSRVFRPYYSASHAFADSGAAAYWIARRRPSDRADLAGTDMVLGFKDLAFQPTRPATQVVFAHLLCTNRGAAPEMPPGSRLEIEADLPLTGISSLTRPTRQLDPPLGGDTLWRLVSHLSLNHLSLTSGNQGLDGLKEILRLYGGRDPHIVDRQLTGLCDLSVRPAVMRIGTEAWRGFCRGTDVTLTVDEEFLDLGNAYLLGTVLSRFLGLYASVNTFTRLVMLSRQHRGVRMTWPPMAGDTRLL